VAGTGRRTYRRRCSALEAASLVLSVTSGATFLLLVSFVSFLDRVAGLSTGEMDAPGLGLVAHFAVLACILSTVVALALAAAALLRPGRGWRYPAVAWMVGASILAYAAAQDVLWTPVGPGRGQLVGLEGPMVHQGAKEVEQDTAVMEKGWGPQPARGHPFQPPSRRVRIRGHLLLGAQVGRKLRRGRRRPAPA
jgi:hypothetical protein